MKNRQEEINTLAAFNELMSKASNGNFKKNDRGFAEFFVNGNHPMLSGALVTDHPNPEDVALYAKKLCTQINHPVSIWCDLFDEEGVTFSKGLCDIGIPWVSEVPSMLLCFGALESVAIDNRLNICWASTKSDIKDFWHICSLCFNNRGYQGDILPKTFKLSSSVLLVNAHIALVKEKNNIVGVGMLIIQDESASLHWIATLPENRSRGIATYCTRALVNMAYEKGAKNIYLQSSARGIPVYSMLGFKTVFWRQIHLVSPIIA